MLCSVRQSCSGNPISYVPINGIDGVSPNDVVPCAQQLGRTCIYPLETAVASTTSSPTTSPTSSPSPSTTCSADSSVAINEFAWTLSLFTTTPAFEIRGPSGQVFTGKLVFLGVTEESTSADSSSDETFQAEQVHTVFGTFDSNGLLIVTNIYMSSKFFTVVLCSEFDLTREDAIAVNYDATLRKRYVSDPSIFGTIYDVIAAIPGSYLGTIYPVILSGFTVIGTYFINVGTYNYEFSVVFRDSCTLDLYAVSTSSNSSTLTRFVVGADGNEYQLDDFSPLPGDSTFGAINPKRTTSG